jgi:GTP-binding protein
MIFISALSGLRVSKLFDLIHEVADAHARRIPTSKLNAFLREAVAAFSPHAVEGKLPKLYFMTQVGVRPPSFVLKTNTDRGLHFSYVRYLENRLRDTFDLRGTPLRLSVQKKQKGDEPAEDAARVRRILDPGEGLKPSKGSEAYREQKAKRAGTVAKRARPAKKAAEKPAAKQAPRKGKDAPPKRVRQKSTKRG